jgi:hypothetical protein
LLSLSEVTEYGNPRKTHVIGPSATHYLYNGENFKDREFAMSFCPLSEIKSPRLHEFAAYLAGKRDGDAVVRRRDIDPPVEIPRLIAGALMIEKIRDGLPDAGRFRVRLVGSGLAAIAERDYTGKWLDEIGVDVDLTSAVSELQAIFAGSEVFSGSHVLPWETRAHVVVEWVAARLDAGPDLNDLVMFVFDKQP